MRMTTGMVAGLIVLLFSAFFVPASAMTASDGNVGKTLVISDIPVGTDVFLTMNNGLPIFARAESDGTVKYLPLIEGTLKIEVKKGKDIIDVRELNIRPKIVTNPSSGRGGGGSSGDGTYPTITSTPRNNQTNVTESIPVDEVTSPPTGTVTEQIPGAVETEPRKDLPKTTEESPGFGIVAAIGLISMIYILRRNK